jgi:hypothetical protein
MGVGNLPAQMLFGNADDADAGLGVWVSAWDSLGLGSGSDSRARAGQTVCGSFRHEWDCLIRAV